MLHGASQARCVGKERAQAKEWHLGVKCIERTTHKRHQNLDQSLDSGLCIGTEYKVIRKWFTHCIAPQSEQVNVGIVNFIALEKFVLEPVIIKEENL